MTGETLNGLNLESMITWGCTNMSVTLKCSDFTITRSLTSSGTSKAEFKHGTAVINQKKEIDAAICDMFGFVDKSVFRLVYFAEQLRALEVIETTNSGRVDMLSTLFGFSRLEKIRAELQKVLASIDVSTVGDDIMETLRQQVAAFEEMISNRSEQHRLISANLLTAEDEAEYRKILAAPTAGTRDSIEQQLIEAQFEHDTAYVDIQKLPEAPDTSEVQTASAYGSYRSLTDSLDKVNDDLGTIGEFLSTDRIQAFLDNLLAHKSAKLHKIEELNRRKTLTESGKCPITGGEPCPDLLNFTDSAKIDSRVVDIQNDLNKLAEDEKEMREELAKSKALENRKLTLMATKAQLEQSLSSYDSALLENFDIDAFMQRMNKSEESAAERKRLSDIIAKASVKVADLKAKLSTGSSDDEATVESKQEATDKLESNVQNLANLKALEAGIAEAETSLAKAKDSLALAEAQNRTAEVNLHKKKILTDSRNILHRDNLPRMLVNELLSTLNKNLNLYLNQFNFPFEVTWSSSGALTYTNELGQALDAKLLSGGQRYVLVVALRCAFASLFKAKFPLFVMDEPTTGLDVENREALSSVITAFAESRNMVTVIPTHDEMLIPESNVIKL